MRTITAKFVGEDGSLDFKNGSKYKLTVHINTHTNEIIVKSIGVLNTGAICVYTNIYKLLDNRSEINNVYERR